jgi:hypothetical protein
MQELYCSFTVDAHARKQDIVTFYDELSVLEVIQLLLIASDLQFSFITPFLCWYFGH